MEKGKLTPKQERFCQEYVIDCNATQAAVRAGYSEKGANSKGAQLLANISISSRIRQLQMETAKKINITREWITNELIEIQSGSKTTYPPSSLKALEMLAKMYGLNEPEKIEISGELNQNINLRFPGLEAENEQYEEPKNEQYEEPEESDN